MDILLALLAAFPFALGLVLQEKAAASLPAEAVGIVFAPPGRSRSPPRPSRRIGETSLAGGTRESR